jgi:hypothetical protein
MTTNIHIHGKKGDKISAEVNDWGTYISVEVSFGGSSVTMYPKENSDVSVAEQVHDILKAFASMTVNFPQTTITE